MKTTIAALLMLAVLTGCGDSNYYTTSGGTTTPWPPADPPPTIAGNAAFIPANTYCTAKMNFVLLSEGVPDSIAVVDGPNSHRYEWWYNKAEYVAKYYFNFADLGFYMVPGETCNFDFYKAYTITP